MRSGEHSDGSRLVSPATGWPREVVVEHGDGTVSLLANVAVSEGTVRNRRAGDVFREELG
jgi:hypothetical protein